MSEEIIENIENIEKIQKKKTVEISLAKFEQMIIKIKEYKKANAYLNNIIRQYNAQYGSLSPVNQRISDGR